MDSPSDIDRAPSGLTAPTANRLVIRASEKPHVISRNIYGHFAEHLGRGIYEGIWVGPDSAIANTRGIRNDVVAALKRIRIPVLRWPGGCFADEYHWRDGIGPRRERPAMLNTHWGGVVESNHFGTHEFMDLCEQTGAEPYISGNVGSGSAREMMEWVEYMTADGDSPMVKLRRQNGREKPWRLPYFGIGNESWGCGGNMRPEYYSDLYRRYNTFVKNYDRANPVARIACGANSDDTNWTEVVMREVGDRMQGLSLHYYTFPGGWQHKGSATRFDETEWHTTLRKALVMDDLVTRHAAIMDRTDPDGRIAMIVDEWGSWYDVEPGTNPGFLYQQNSLRDALLAGSTLNIFNRRCDRVKMANIAQTVNVLQAMLLTDGEKLVLTPTFHVFELYAVHQEATLLCTELQTPDYIVNDEAIPVMNVSASTDAAGKVHVTFCNLHPSRPARVECTLETTKARRLSGRVLTAPAINSHNTFEQPGLVTPLDFDAFAITDAGFTATLPAKSVVALEVETAAGS
jgi:alpha-N-arabinofuranosidase